MSSLEQSMRATTEKFLYSWSRPWHSALEPNLSCRAPQCTHTILPKALNMPPRTNQEFAEYFTKIAPLITEATMTINTYIPIPASHQVVARSSMTATTAVGPFENEYIWFLTFDEKGEKIIEIEEFLDRAAAEEFFGRLKAAGLR